MRAGKAVEFGVLVVAVCVAWWALVAKQHAEDEALIASENYAAAMDTVRTIRLVSRGKDTALAYLSSLLQTREIALEGALRRLAKSEGLVVRFRADLAVAGRRVDTVLVGVAPPLVGDSGRLVDSVAVTGPPVTGQVRADMAPWRPTVWGLRLQPDPIPLTIVVGCRDRGPPELIVTGPTWATVAPTLGVLDARVCHPTRQKARWPWFVGGALAGILTWEAVR